MNVIFERQCSCHGATASGPRIVLTQTRYEGAVRVVGELVPMACDTCDRSWSVSVSRGSLGTAAEEERVRGLGASAGDLTP